MITFLVSMAVWALLFSPFEEGPLRYFVAALFAAFAIALVFKPRGKGRTSVRSDVPSPAFAQPPSEVIGPPQPVQSLKTHDPIPPNSVVSAADLPAEKTLPPVRIQDSSFVQKPPIDEITPDQAIKLAVGHMLEALLHASGAHTAALLRDLSTPSTHKYLLQAIASRNAYARTEATLILRQSLSSTTEKDGVQLIRIGGGLHASALRYYRDQLAIREMLAVSLRMESLPFVLVLDSQEDGLLNQPRTRTLLAITARMFEHAGFTLPTPVDDYWLDEPVTADPIVKGVTDGLIEEDEHTRRATLEALGIGQTPSKPRTEILQEEMDASSAQSPLIFTLIALADPQVSEDELLNLELTLRETVETGASGERVEQFGELTYGVFFRGSEANAEMWFISLYALLERTFPHYIFGIGAVQQSDRHTSAKQLREEAHALLLQSFTERSPVLS